MSDAALVPELRGHVIELLISDSQGDPAVAVESVQRLVVEGVIVIISGDFGGALIAEAEIAKKLGVPLIAGTNIGILHSSNPHPWVFQLLPNESRISEAIFAQLRELASDIWSANKSYAIAFGSSGLQESIGAIYEKALQSFDLNYTGWFNLNNPDSAPKADAVLILGASVKQILENDPRLSMYNFVLVDTLFIDEIKLSQASFKDRMVLFSFFSQEAAITKSIGKTFTGAYRSMTGRDPDDSAALGYTSILLPADGLRRIRDFTGDSMRKALQTVEISGDKFVLPWNEIRFNDAGENIGARPILLKIRDNIGVPL